MNANIFRSMSYGAYVMSTMDRNRPTGCIANSIMQITSSPATIAVGIDHDNYTNRCTAASGKFVLPILAENFDSGLIGTFGLQCGKGVNKFDSATYEVVEGVSVAKDFCDYVVCRVVDAVEMATYTVSLGEVVEEDVYEGAGDAVVYAHRHKVIKGKAPENAPAYLPETEERADRSSNSPTYKWICQVCGYVYEGEELPADFTCPICRQGADKSKLVEE